MTDRYGRDVLAGPPRRGPAVPEVPAERDLVVECADSGFCGAVVAIEKGATGWAVTLEDRHGRRRGFTMAPAGFLLDGRAVTLVPPSTPPAPAATRSASGSRRVEGLRARVARGSRLWVEGDHDAALVEHVWGHDLRVEGVVVEALHGADDLVAAVTDFAPAPGRRLGILLDHLVAGSKESRLADDVRSRWPDHVLVLGHPYVDVWAAVRPERLGLRAWPDVRRGEDWKTGVMSQLGWSGTTGEAWQRILGTVRGYGDLDPALLGRVEELIDFVTAD